MKQLPVVVLISGTGSNFRAICEAIDAGHCAATIKAVVSDRAGAKGLELARERGLPIEIVKLSGYENRALWDRALADAVAKYAPELIVLAGFMKIIGAPMLERFGGKIINLHPALLPLFPGTDGTGDAIRAGVKISGCTVHQVDAGTDTGPILAQAAVRVYPGDTGDSLHKRIQRAEHRILPWVVDQIARGAITLAPAIQTTSDQTDDTEILFSPEVPDR
jgi:phosphoribosylglycinamide formyltransferase 1